MAMRIELAIALAKDKGIKINKKKLAQKIWSSSEESVASMNMTRLLAGKTKKIEVEWVNIICDECGCDPNFLFGYENK